MIVADRDVLIDTLHGQDPAARRVAEGLEAGTLATTAISAFELLSGAREPEQQEAVSALLGALPILPFDQRSGELAARARLELEGRGQAIGMGDYLIAGVCLSRAASLLTRNRKHFQRVSGLEFAELS